MPTAGTKTNRPDSILPRQRSVPDADPLHYTWLLYGRPKIGKSTFFAQWPGVLFLECEPGLKGLEVFKITVKDWSAVRKAVVALEAGGHAFRFAVFDTVDRAYDMCLDTVCRERGIEYPGEDASGHNDYGRSWRAVRQEFLSTIHRLIRTGLGVGFTSHAEEREIKTRAGERWDCVYPTMSGQARSVVESIVDFWWFADYVRLEGQAARVLITQGDDTIWAGSRKGIASIPPLLRLSETEAFRIVSEAFRGKGGIVPQSARADRRTTVTASRYIRAAAAVGAGKPKGGK